MAVFVFIPARYGSSRFPGKPLAPIAGRPMIRHVYERAGRAEQVSGVYVATDDPRIAQCVEGFGGRAVMTRPSHASGSDRIHEAALLLGVKDGDIVVNVQGDQPLLDPRLIALLTAPFEEDPTLPISTLMWRFRDPRDVPNPNHVKVVVDARGFALYFSRSPIPHYRDEAGEWPFFKHLGVYAFRMEALGVYTALPKGRLEEAEKLEQLRALEHGMRIRVLETETDSLEVDVPGDIRTAEALLAAEGLSRSPGAHCG